MAKLKQPSRPTSPKKDTSERSPPPTPNQGISGRLFGMFKRFPMAITSPTKEVTSLSSQQNQYSHSEEQTDSEQDHDENDDDQDHDQETSLTESEEEEEEEEEDPLGDEQCQAIMENFLLETSTRTHLLRSRIQTHFRPALRRRLDFELSRITPSIANVSALDYHQRDQGVLRCTMEHVARLEIEKKTLSIGMKRSQSEQELVWNEIEQTHHHKRQRQLTGNAGSASFKSSKQRAALSRDHSPPNGHPSGRPLSRSKPPPTSRSIQAGQSRKRSNSSVEPTELNPRLPSTPLTSKGKPVRLARRNESLLSVNGSPVLSIGPDDNKHFIPTSASTSTITSKFSELFPSTTSASLNDDFLKTGHLPTSHTHLNHITQFTFVEKSKWKELESQLNSLKIDHSQRLKLDELLKGCLNFGDG